MNKITLKNISSGTVVISVPDVGFRREMMPNREFAITQEEYNAIIFDPGVNALVEGHYITFSGLDEDEVAIADSENVVDTATISQMLKSGDITAFAKFLPNAKDAEKETAVKLAIEYKITDNAFIALIKKYCDVDVISAINLQHQLES